MVILTRIPMTLFISSPFKRVMCRSTPGIVSTAAYRPIASIELQYLGRVISTCFKCSPVVTTGFSWRCASGTSQRESPNATGWRRIGVLLGSRVGRASRVIRFSGRAFCLSNCYCTISTRIEEESLFLLTPFSWNNVGSEKEGVGKQRELCWWACVSAVSQHGVLRVKKATHSPLSTRLQTELYCVLIFQFFNFF